MITVHHLDNSRSQRMLWLLEELGVDYDIKRYRRDSRTMLAPKSLRKVHPLGKSPVITEDGLVIAESGAIIEYLVDRHGGRKLVPPPRTPERLRYTYWLHFAEGSAMTPLLLSLLFDKLPSQPMPILVRPIVRAISSRVLASFVNPQIETHRRFMEDELAKSPWFAGDKFTAADIQMSFVVEALAASEALGTKSANLSAWLERIHARPAYIRALEKGGPYELKR